MSSENYLSNFTQAARTFHFAGIKTIPNQSFKQIKAQVLSPSFKSSCSAFSFLNCKNQVTLKLDLFQNSGNRMKLHLCNWQ